ncbi:hypothetical protein JOM56_013016 [Amanita muscaria]
MVCGSVCPPPMIFLVNLDAPRYGVWERLPPSRDLFGQLRAWMPLDAVCGSVCPPPVIFLVNCERCVGAFAPLLFALADAPRRSVWERLPPSCNLFGQLRMTRCVVRTACGAITGSQLLLFALPICPFSNATFHKLQPILQRDVRTSV